MTHPMPPQAAHSARGAAQLFAEFVQRRRSDPALDLEAWCRAHPDAARELRVLAAHWERVHAVLEQLGVPAAQSGPASAPGVGSGVPAGAATTSAGSGPAPSSELLRRLFDRRHVADRYAQRGEVARGGMGAILRVWDEDLRRNLAMKVVLGAPPGTSAEQAAARDHVVLGRFLEEAQITSQLEHPGIVPVHELGVDHGGRAFFTMRLVTGRDLEHIFGLVRDGQEGWTRTRAVGVVLKICEAMAYAHDKGVIHRDLKPANVMIGRFGEVYVMDWGLARVLGKEETVEPRPRAERPSTASGVSTFRLDLRHSGASSPLQTMDGDVVGTPAYMSPEQARGDLATMGPASDIYSTGAILYHLLAGHTPYAPPGTEPTMVEVWERVRAGTLEPLHERAPDAPAELIAICEKAMERDPADRYPGMLALAEDLRAYLEGRVVHAYETGAVAEFKKWVQRNKGIARTVLAALVVIVGGTTTASLVLAGKNQELQDANVAIGLSEKKARDNERTAQLNASIAEDRATRLLRLSDSKQLQLLAQSAEKLWPAHPERLADLEAWLAEARDLVSRLPDHEAALRELRARAVRTPDAAAGAQGTGGAPAQAAAAPGAAGAEPAGAPAYEFASTAERWQHDVQAELVAGLEAFASLDFGGIPDVERRAEFARTIEQRSLGGEARAAWDAALRAVAGSPRYPGVELRPLLGFLPLGADPDSGLQEFAHLQSGAPAVRDPATGDLVLTDETGLVFVLVPGGELAMGAQRDDPGEENYDPDAQPDESPVRRVALAPYLISKYELTQAQWLRGTGANPSLYPAGTTHGGVLVTRLHPVEQVSWDECAELLRRYALELPTEAQWEHAARAGRATRWWTGDERETLEDACNVADLAARNAGAPWSGIDEWPEFDDGAAVHAPCDAFLPNPFGLHNVHGNVFEWCRDAGGFYDRSFAAWDGELEGGNPAMRPSRGGSFYHGVSASRSANRTVSASQTRNQAIGLRPALALPR